MLESYILKYLVSNKLEQSGVGHIFHLMQNAT